MRTNVGDRVRIHGRAVGMAERTGQVIEIRGPDDHQLLVVRFDDGHESLVYPGPDLTVVRSTA